MVLLSDGLWRNFAGSSEDGDLHSCGGARGTESVFLTLLKYATAMIAFFLICHVSFTVNYALKPCGALAFVESPPKAPSER